MNIEYEIELQNVLHAMFPDKAERERVVEKMSKYGKEPYQREAPRVKLSILKLAFNEPDKLGYYIEEACKDYRDILCWAEYPETSRRRELRNANPEKYKQLREKEAREFLAWLASQRQA